MLGNIYKPFGDAFADFRRRLPGRPGTEVRGVDGCRTMTGLTGRLILRSSTGSQQQRAGGRE
jgi:hypothetical protein